MKSVLTAILLFAVFASACTYTQKVKDGDFAFDRKQYAVATGLLEKEFKKEKSRVQKGKKAYLLGESYRLLNKPASASDWYKRAYDNGYGVDALKGYAFSLKAMQQYTEAMQAFKDLGIEIGSPYEYRREIAACKVALGWANEKRRAYRVQPVDFNSHSSDYAPSIYKGRKLVFTSDRSAATGDDTYNWTGSDFSDLFTADLSTNSVEPFDGQINTPYNEGTAAFNGDFTEMYFTRCFGNKKEDNFCKLMVSKRSGDHWTVPAALGFVQDKINYGHPALSADGQRLFFSCNSDEGWGGYDIWVSQRTAGGWAEPKLMGRSINTIGNEKFPCLDGDTLYFSSDFHPGMGGLDIFKTWQMANGAWVPVKNLKAPINSGADDFGLVVDHEGQKTGDVLEVGYFSSNRPDGTGSDDIYRFEKRVLPPEPEKPKPEIVDYKLVLEGYVLEKIYTSPDDPDSKVLGRKPLEGATVKVSFGENKKEFTVGSDGFFTFEMDEDTDYHFIGSKGGYLTSETAFSTRGIGKDPDKPVQTFEVELVLDRIFVNKEIVLEDIYYDFDKWDIRDDAKPSLIKLARNLELNPNIRIELSSHTDCRGKNAYNLELSQKRAQAAVDFLVGLGISADRLQAKGFGESVPKANCLCNRCSEEEHQLNRRTAFKILDLQ
ncbi:MAG TPA: flagellar motor protein MotB [Bacteroidetes bacterium]|nr:flagellar motor protein MotB [Bacteroidota bacterium]